MNESTATLDIRPQRNDLKILLKLDINFSEVRQRNTDTYLWCLWKVQSKTRTQDDLRWVDSRWGKSWMLCSIEHIIKESQTGGIHVKDIWKKHLTVDYANINEFERHYVLLETAVYEFKNAHDSIKQISMEEDKEQDNNVWHKPRIIITELIK